MDRGSNALFLWKLLTKLAVVCLHMSAVSGLQQEESKPTGTYQLPKPQLSARQAKAYERRDMREEMYFQSAWLRSAILPGWGQAYNRQLWKVPVVYGVLAALGGGVVYNHQAYLDCKKQLLQDQRNGRGVGHVLHSRAKDYKRERDIYAICIGLWYILNILDAYTVSNLKTFNLSDDISLEILPVPRSSLSQKPQLGVGVGVRVHP